MYDILISGGSVVDGTGAPARIADIAINEGRIVAVGKVDGPARKTIDAAGLVVTPGFVDIHTHYDGQATWDTELDPSFSSGVTTAILGNCGVGFAPVRRGTEERLIELMEGVEEIPGTALHEGLKWNWESFPEYLDVLDSLPHTMDIGALLPHGPLRLYAMADKIGTDQPASEDQLATMERLVDEAMAAGAFGLSSSRTPVHRTSIGTMTPDFDADEPELLALARPVAKHGGYFEFAPNGVAGEDFGGLQLEMQTFRNIVEQTDVAVHLLVSQTWIYPDYWREQLRWADAINDGNRKRAYLQIGGRGISVIMSFVGTHPFMRRPTFLKVKALPREQWAAALAEPATKAAILAEVPDADSMTAADVLNAFLNRAYDLGGHKTEFEPDESASVQTIADATGKSIEEVVYDLLLRDVEKPQILFIALNYASGSFKDLREMITHPAAVLSGSDAGAHVLTICDGSVYTYMLTHWVRDRHRGDKLPLEQVVRMMTHDTAASIGMEDRGIIAAGKKADINVIDLDRLNLETPVYVNDLPGGAARLLQRATGYRATIVSGVITRENDQATGAKPGKLVRKTALH